MNLHEALQDAGIFSAVFSKRGGRREGLLAGYLVFIVFW